VQEITLTTGSSIDFLLPGSGSKDGFEHSTFKHYVIWTKWWCQYYTIEKYKGDSILMNHLQKKVLHRKGA
jgi:hypothetical protein